MKIGVIVVGHECETYLQESLNSWITTKKENLHDIYISVVHALFEPNQDFGMNVDSKDLTETILEHHYENGNIDEYTKFLNPVNEWTARNEALTNLKKYDCDLYWILDLDELYTKDQIYKIIDFVRRDKFSAWFSINFKNHVFDGTKWIDGFCPPRIFNNRLYGGVKEFYYDNDIHFELLNYKVLSNREIPRSIAHIKHMTWLHSNGEKKVRYQKARWGEDGCSYSFIDGQLCFNESFYKKHNLQYPLLHSD